jgi:tetratricopeptide (TPR) repeat protein
VITVFYVPYGTEEVFKMIWGLLIVVLIVVVIVVVRQKREAAMSADKLILRGSDRINKGKYLEAIADFERSLQKEPNNENAKNKLEEVKKSRVTWAKSAYDSGVVHSSKGEYDSAIADFEKAAKLDPNNPDFKKALEEVKDTWAKSAYDSGVVHSSKGEYGSAVADFKKAIELDPNNADFKKALEEAEDMKVIESDEKLKTTPGLEVALQIKNELVNKGYKVGKLSKYSQPSEGTVGNFYVYSGDSSVGRIAFSYSPGALSFVESHLQIDNIQNVIVGKLAFGIYYAIENANIGLIVTSAVKTVEIPPFLEIAANVIKSSEYVFKHPNWLFEERGAKEYLNVMFE